MPVPHVLFDESHSQAWTVRPEVAAQLQPHHPADSSYAAAATALRAHGLTVAAWTGGGLDAGALEDAAVLVLAHPSESRWEAVVPGGSPRFTDAELDAIEAFVARGGGLVVLAEEEQEKYGTNLDVLCARFGIGLEHASVSDYEHHHAGSPHWVLGDLRAGGVGGDDLLARVHDVCLYRAGALRLDDRATVLVQAQATASVPGAPLVAVTTHGAGRVVVLADSDLFGDDCLGELDHEPLWLDLVTWAAGPALAVDPAPVVSAAAEHPAWARLKDATEALRVRQQPDGSVADGGAEEAALVDTMTVAVDELAPLFPHQAAYCAAVVADLRAWVAGGFAKPDFTASLEAFRPDQHREDGIEHLVVFPMYKQNGSRDTCFEALVVRVPWPAWLAELERTRYDNAKFVPVTFVDRTSGYDSECAVLFPETVSVSGTPVNFFGGIFCDREAARFRATTTKAAAVLGLQLPPDARALTTSAERSEAAYLLWDLVHDRTHARGDLPFDPFMIRQRMPYWMYALEELRCDLTAFSEAVLLEREGMAAARDVQYAILFDRLFRFPVVGTRVRNYDGLGGQLLFAYLHRHGYLAWTDNRLTIDWDRVAEGVVGLRREVEELYRAGIDRSKVAHWGAAHDLVASYVPAAEGSRWVRGERAFAHVEDPRPYIDEVRDDEFPLSIFYVSLKRRLVAA